MKGYKSPISNQCGAAVDEYAALTFQLMSFTFDTELIEHQSTESQTRRRRYTGRRISKDH